MNTLRAVPGETARLVAEELRQVANSLLWCREVDIAPEFVQVEALVRLASTIERAAAPTHLRLVPRPEPLNGEAQVLGDYNLYNG